MIDDDGLTVRGRLPRVLTRRDAMLRGLSPDAVDRRVASGRWRRVLPRTYFTGETFGDADRLVAATLYAGSESALSGAAGLVASGVRSVAMPARVLVVVPPTSCSVSTGWVLVRRTPHPFHRVPRREPARVDAARAAADLAVTMRRLDDVRALVARVVQDGHCTIEQLAVELANGPRRGSAHLRQALAEVGAGAASAPEARAAGILRRGGITDFVQNAEVVLPDGSVRYLDFLWRRLRACLEIDSVEFHFEQRAWSQTWDRHLDLTTFGYAVIHRPPSALREPERFLRDVRRFLAGREADLSRGLG